MGHFRVFSLKAEVLPLLFILLISQVPVKGNDVNSMKGPLPNLTPVFQLVNSFVKPYLRSLGNNMAPTLRTRSETPVEKAIREKIAELQPYLQDNDMDPNKNEEDNNLTLEGNDETTIIEFVGDDYLRKKNENPKKIKRSEISDTERKEIKKTGLLWKDKIHRYKEIRRNIITALRNERVSTNTLSLVTNTLDEMTARMIENKCPPRHESSNSLALRRVDKSISIVNEWSEQWGRLKEQYLTQTKNHPADPAVKIFRLFEQLHEFVSHIVKDIQELAQYKVTCEFSKPDNDKKYFKYNNDYNSNKNVLRKGNKTNVMKKKSICKYFKVCSEEISKFMGNFYVTLNDTAVSALRNYASMYARDVNTEDSQEKENIITIINNISDLAEHKTRKIFIRETANFKLNENKDVNANIRLIKNYVKNTVDKTKKNIEDILQNGLKTLKAKLTETIVKDLSINLNVDLDNLARDLKMRICSDFSFCNGKIVGRRFGDDVDPHFNKRNSVYVKVQLSFDDEFKRNVGRSNFPILNHQKPESPVTYKKHKNKNHRFVKQTRMYRRLEDINTKAKLNVTRTTLFTTSTTKGIKLDNTTAADTKVNTQNLVNETQKVV